MENTRSWQLPAAKHGISSALCIISDVEHCSHQPGNPVARLQALLRRTQPASASAPFGRLSLDATSRRALVGGEPLELSGREWTLLELLVNQRDKVVTKEQINQAWSDEGGETGGGNSIEVYIHRLRRKLEDAGLVIRTVRGLGYLLEAQA